MAMVIATTVPTKGNIMTGFMICTTQKYYTGNRITRNEMGTECGNERERETRGAHRVLMGKPEERIPLVRLRSRLEDIKMDLTKTRLGRGLMRLRIGTGGELL